MCRQVLERRHDRRDRRRDEHGISGQELVEARDDADAVALRRCAGAFVRVVTGDLVPVAKRQRQRAADQAEPGDADPHFAATCSVRPTARATCGTASMSARKLSKLSDWNPSESAWSGLGCTSTRRPSAPAATAASAIGATRYHLPVPCDGSASTGRCEERRVGKECRSRWSPY